MDLSIHKGDLCLNVDIEQHLFELGLDSQHEDSHFINQTYEEALNKFVARHDCDSNILGMDLISIIADLKLEHFPEFDNYITFYWDTFAASINTPIKLINLLRRLGKTLYIRAEDIQKKPKCTTPNSHRTSASQTL